MSIKIPKISDYSSSKKIIDFGNVQAKILELNYRTITNTLGQVSLVIEGKADKDFVGITTKKGVTYKGPVGFIELSKFLINKTKETSITAAVRKLGYIAEAVGVSDEFMALDGKCETIEQFVSEFKKLDIYNKYVYWCIGAKEKGKNNNGFMNYTSYIVDSDLRSSKYPVANDDNKVILFDRDKHIERMQLADNNINDFMPKSNNDLPDFLTKRNINDLPSAPNDDLPSNTPNNIEDKNINDIINDDTNDSLPF